MAEPGRQRAVRRRRRRGRRGRRERAGSTTGRRRQPDVLAIRSRLYPDTERTMGWDVGSSGLRIVLDAQRAADGASATSARTSTASSPTTGSPGTTSAGGSATPAARRCSRRCRTTLDLPREALQADLGLAGRGSATCRRPRCCTSSRTPCATGRRDPARYGLLLAMGPGFCSELVLLRAARRWPCMICVHPSLVVARRRSSGWPSWSSRSATPPGASTAAASRPGAGTTRSWWCCTPACWSAASSRSGC